MGSAEYRCANDCEQTGCPGHVLSLRMNCTSDTIAVVEDGKEWETFDGNRLYAIVDIVVRRKLGRGE